MAITPWEVEDLDRWTEGALKRGATSVILRLRYPPTMVDLWGWARRWEGLFWIVHARWATQPFGYGMHFPAPPISPPPRPDPAYAYGQSCHSVEEVALAAPWASYVWIGSFFPTPSHPHVHSPLPLSLLSTLRTLYPTLPLVAVGGIDSEEKIEQIRIAGAGGFAAIRYFLRV